MALSTGVPSFIDHSHFVSSLSSPVVSKTCSNGVRESLQKQLESLSKQLEETRRERRSLQERSVAMEKEKRQLQNEVVLAQHSQSSTRLESGDLLSRKEQQLQEMKVGQVVQYVFMSNNDASKS